MNDKGQKIHGVSKSKIKNGTDLTRIVIVEIIVLIATFIAYYSLWNLFDMDGLSRQVTFLWGILVVSIVMIAVAVIYSEQTKDKRNNDGCEISKKK